MNRHTVFYSSGFRPGRVSRARGLQQCMALLRGAGIGLLMALALMPTAQADDTDIYLKPPVNGDPPIVMLMLPYRPNLGNTVCSDFLGSDRGESCKQAVGDSVWPNLVNLICNNTFNLGSCSLNSGDGLIDGTIAGGPADDAVDTFDIFRAILITLIADDELYGVRVGIMLSHNQATDKDTKVVIGTNRQVLSDGAMIMQGVLELQETDIAYDWTDGSNNARDILIKKIQDIPAPHGSLNHPFAPKENFYEFYQYLTGGKVFTGDNGYLDFGDQTLPSGSFTAPETGAAVSQYHPARYNLDKRTSDVASNRDGDEDNAGPDARWPTNMVNGSVVSFPPPAGFSFQNTWDSAICEGGYIGNKSSGDNTLANKNYSQSCISCRNGEGATCTAATYKDPFDGVECSKVFAITSYVANSFDTSADSNITTVMNSVNPAPSPAVTLAAGDAGVKQWLRWLYEQDLSDKYDGQQNVTTYLIADSNKFAEATAIAALTGSAGNVLSLEENPDALLAKLKEVFKNILIKSATFTAPSIPVNVFDRTDINNVAYLAMFQSSGQPLWPGNVKKFFIDNNAQIVDVNGVPAYETITVNNADGSTTVIQRIKDTSLSGWTSPTDLPVPVTEDGASVGNDGRAVRLGGAGQLIPGNKNSAGNPINPIALFGSNSGRDNGGFGSTRMLFTDDGSSLDALNASTADAQLGSELGSTTDDLAAGGTLARFNEELIGWARGNNVTVDGVNGDGVTDFWGTPRTWMMGDVLHSKPVVISYGTGGAQDSRVFFGSNDGFFHQVKDSGAMKTEGGEVWAYMPQELLGNLRHLKLDSHLPQHLNGVDGQATPVIVDGNQDAIISGSDKAYLYFGLRRGGNAYYALDVSNPDAKPELKWKITNQDSDFEKMGMTFARPIWGFVRPDSSDPFTALFLAGGYNGGYVEPDGALKVPQERVGKDVYDAIGTDDDIGNTVYIVQRTTGKLIWSAKDHVQGGVQMLDSIAAEPAPFDSNGDGIVDRLYVADTGGRVWRIDLPSGDMGNWKTTLLADLGRHKGASIADDRRFFSPPSIVPTKSSDGTRYTGVVLISGDREHPTQGTNPSNEVTNSLFVIKDKDFTSSPPANAITRSDMQDLTSNTYSGGAVDDKDLSWFVDLSAADGEIGGSRATVLFGTVFFTTYTPTTSNKCSIAEGRSFSYAVNFTNASPSENVFNTDGKAYDEIGEGMVGDHTVIQYQQEQTDDPSTPEDESAYTSDELALIINGRTFVLKEGMLQELYWRDIGLDPIH